MNTPHFRGTPYVPKVLKREKTTLSNPSSDVTKDPVRVYCRIRPLGDDTEESCISLVSPTILSLNSPSDSRYPCQKEMHCHFKQIFTSYATQKELFDFVALPLLQDLIHGKNALLLSYGVTGSGKTFTFSGEPNNPGLMPRCIDTIFNTIGKYQSQKFIIKPDKMNGFEIQSEYEAEHDRIIDTKTNICTPRGKVNRKAIGDHLQYLNEGSRIQDINERNLYAVFVSYIEIYNNTVYDLLDESTGKILQSKILREDSQKNVYVNGAVEIEVKSAEEAFEVLNSGQKRKRMGHTFLNSESSRSHSIFNIRLVQIQNVSFNDEGIPIMLESNVIKVSHLSLVDLAGSERTNRAQTTGLRLKEAGRINNSLMCLRNCLEILRENQLTGSNKIVPYRDTRLTFLFKNFFEGYGKVEMIVCVNPVIADYEENTQVMKFAEITQDVNIKRKEMRNTPSVRKTIKKVISTPASKIKSNSALVLPKIPLFVFNPDNFDEMDAQLGQIVNSLKRRNTKMESYCSDFKNKEVQFRKRLGEMNDQNILFSNEVISLKAIIKKEKQLSNKLKNNILELENVNDDLLTKSGEAQEAIRTLRQKIDEKDLKINQKILEKEKTKQKMALVSEKMSQELDNKLRKQREYMKATMKAKDNKIKMVKQILESDDIEVVKKVEESPPYEPEVTPPMLPEPESANRRGNHTPSVRQRRSRSAGEVWLEHNSIKPVALGTVLQPSMKKRKSLTKLTKATDITNPKQSKYCLIAQDHDTRGEIETKLYKGDIVPTCGGGAQVIFNDVELLRQRSPTSTP